MQNASLQEEEIAALRATTAAQALPQNWDIRSQISIASIALNVELEKSRRIIAASATNAAKKAAEIAELQERVEAAKQLFRELLARSRSKLAEELQRDLAATRALELAKQETSDLKKQNITAKIAELRAKSAALKTQQSTLALEIEKKQKDKQAAVVLLTEKNAILRQFHASNVPTVAQLAAQQAENEKRIDRLYRHSHTLWASGDAAFPQRCQPPTY